MFHEIWSRETAGEHAGDVTRAAEKRAFEELVDLLIDRLDSDESMHVYHYAAYEKTALAKLAQRYATREEEVDRLLRGRVLVDLFRVVNQGIRASVESYSIKRLEGLYEFVREEDLKSAGSSIVAFEAWLDGGEDENGELGDDILRSIAEYNRDDVVSNLKLRDWLEERRLDLAAKLGQDIPRPPIEPNAEEPQELTAPAAGRRRPRRSAHDRPAAGRAAVRSGRGPGSLAPGPAPRLAPARGEGVLVALLRPRHEDRRGARRRARDPRQARIRRGPRPGEEERPRALPLPDPGPRPEARACRREPRDGQGVRAADRRLGPRTRRDRAHGHPQTEPRSAAAAAPEGAHPVRHDRHGRDARGAAANRPVGARRRGRCAGRPSRSARPAASTPASAGAGRRAPACCRRAAGRLGGPARARAGPRDARDPGAAGQRQDVHRGPDDRRPRARREAGGGHRQQPQGHHAMR